MLTIGEIVGPHGVRGEIKVLPLTDFPERFFELDNVKVRKGKLIRNFHVLNVRQHKNLFVFQFQEVQDRNQAEGLRHWELVIDLQAAVAPPEGQYYDYQLEGLEVYDVLAASVLGTIVEIMHLPANAVYRVEKPDGSSLLIPALKQVVKRVDLDGRRMYIEPMEGLLE